MNMYQIFNFIIIDWGVVLEIRKLAMKIDCNISVIFSK